MLVLVLLLMMMMIFVVNGDNKIMVGILIDHDVKTSATESKERPTNKPLASLDARSLKMVVMIVNNDNDNDYEQ